jgi:hypothetical protein
MSEGSSFELTKLPLTTTAATRPLKHTSAMNSRSFTNQVGRRSGLQVDNLVLGLFLPSFVPAFLIMI